MFCIFSHSFFLTAVFLKLMLKHSKLIPNLASNKCCFIAFINMFIWIWHQVSLMCSSPHIIRVKAINSQSPLALQNFRMLQASRINTDLLCFQQNRRVAACIILSPPKIKSWYFSNFSLSFILLQASTYLISDNFPCSWSNPVYLLA